MKQAGVRGLTVPELIEGGRHYVDKTLLIKDILDNNDRGVYLFTRPHGFGKSTNLSMLDAFFNIDYRGTAGSIRRKYRSIRGSGGTGTGSRSYA